MRARHFGGVIAVSALGMVLTGIRADAQAGSPPSRASYPVQLTTPAAVGSAPPQAGPPKPLPIYRPPAGPRAGNGPDPVVQTATPTPTAATAVGQWEGLGAGYSGYSVTAVPPDPNMAVGPNHVVQWVNNAVVIFNKQGAQLQAPVADSTFWGSNSTCYQGGGYSDPIVQYDRAADRWIIGEVALPLLPPYFGQYAQCFAVSKTSDPTFKADANGNNASYYIWAYGFGSNVNDYDKVAVWSDAYYITWNIFQNGNNFIGPEACAWSRTDMLQGKTTPAYHCFQLSNSYASLLASDLDGANAPPVGSPNYLMSVDPSSGSLNVWKFHADFVTPANSTLTGPTSIANVAAFTSPCPTTQNCIPQPGTSQALDALGDRLMYRLAYRNFGDHESLVANHTVVTASGNTGVRWYEVRNPGGTPTLFQQGTFAPDSDNRWMGSIAMDKSGNIAVGYSVSSAATYPSIRYTGWEVGNTPGTLQAETSLASGGGSQTGYNRWGDYSAMRVDPSDDCTFWYTQEYQATTQSADWSTRIGSFKFPSCGQALTATATTLTSSANPSNYGQQVTFTATVGPSSGSGTPTGTVTFKDGSTSLGSSPLNTSGTATFSTASLTAGGHSITATYSGDTTFASGTSAVLSQNVNKANTTTTISSSANPAATGQNVTFTAQVSPSGATGTVTFSDNGNPIGTAPVSGGKASLSTSTLSTGGHSITASYSGDGNYLSSTSSVLTETINGAIATTTNVTSSANPAVRGQKVTFTATVTPSSGSGTPTGTVTFFDGTTSLGSSTLSSGVASLAVSNLSVGSHSITAQYGGSSSYGGSTSGVLTQTVTTKK